MNFCPAYLRGIFVTSNKDTHYVIDDFEGVKVDDYLVNITAEVAYWVNQEAEQGVANACFQVFIDSTIKTC